MQNNHSLNALLWRNPHRYPFMLVDKVLEVLPAVRAVALKTVSLSDLAFSEVTHHPHQPLRYPSHMVIESFCQSAGLALKHDGPVKVYLIAMKGIKVQRSVYPGDNIIHRVEVIRQGKKFLIVKGTSTVDGLCVISYDNILINLNLG